MGLFASTMAQICASPYKSKPGTILDDEFDNPKHRQSPWSTKENAWKINQERRDSARVFWQKHLDGKELTVVELQEASKKTLAGCYSAINRLKQDDLVKVSRTEDSPLGGRKIKYWTWNHDPKPNNRPENALK